MRILTTSYLLILFCIGITQTTNAQKAELGIAGGTSYYIGDLNPYGHFKGLQPMGGLVYRYNFNTRYNLRLNGFYGFVSGDDSKSDYSIQTNRNLSFRSDIIELAGVMELNFYDFHKNNMDYPYSSYMFVGINFFRMNPKANVNGDYVELQPLGTEGQGTSAKPDLDKYKLMQIGIPFGVGLKFNIGEKVVVSLEYGLRKTFTDYLDDVSGTYIDPVVLASESSPLAADLADQSANQPAGINGTNSGLQRGNSMTKDWYSFSGIAISIRMGKEPCQRVLD